MPFKKGDIMTAKIVHFKQATLFPDDSNKPIKKITEEEFIKFVRDAFASSFAAITQIQKFNEFLTLHQLELQDKIMEHEDVVRELKNR